MREACGVNWIQQMEGRRNMKRLLVHFRGGGVWGPHPDAVFQPIAEVFVDLHPRVRRSTWQRNTVGRIGLKKQGERDSPELVSNNKRNFLIFGTKAMVWFFFCDDGSEPAGVPSEKISQRRTPNDQTSLWLVYTLSKMLSGAIHFRGSRACTQKPTNRSLA